MHFNLIFPLFICMRCVGVRTNKRALSTGLECIQPANKDKTETLICINSNFTCVYDCDDRDFFSLQLRLGLGFAGSGNSMEIAIAGVTEK